MNGLGKYTINFGKFKNALMMKKKKFNVDAGSVIFTCRENGLVSMTRGDRERDTGRVGVEYRSYR